MKLRYLTISLISWANKALKARANKKQDSLKILAYHNIKESELEQFQKQIIYLKKNYQIVGPDIFQQETKSGKKILITFDDGFQSNFQVAKEILDPLQIKALFFIPFGFIDIPNVKQYVAANFFNHRLQPEQISDQIKPMSWLEIGDLIKNDHQIGAHTINHQILTTLKDDADLKNEIINSGLLLAQKLNTEIKHFACPFGNSNTLNQKIINIIKERYQFCQTTVRGTNLNYQDSFLLKRDPVPIDAPVQYLDFLVNDGFNFLYKKQGGEIIKLLYC